jgi:cell shape-determining protein MreC
MSNSQIVAAVFTALVGVTVFLLKFMFTKIAQWLEEKLSSLTDRLDSLGDKVDSLVTQFAASAVKNEHNAEEIKILRLRMHDIAQEVHIVKAVQERCKNCAKG